MARCRSWTRDALRLALLALLPGCAGVPAGESVAEEPGPLLELRVEAGQEGRIAHRVELVVDVDPGTPNARPARVSISLPRGKRAADFASAVAANLRKVGLVARFGLVGDGASLELPPPAFFASARASVTERTPDVDADLGTLVVAIRGRLQRTR